MRKYPIRLEGITTWDRENDREAEFTKFILKSPDAFAFEFDYERSHYSGTFHRNTSGMFSGDFSAKGDGGNRSGKGQCELNEKNGIYFLIGIWFEDGIKYDYWHAELSEIDQ
ncbi:MAG: hypothetical protein EPO31_09435 [Gammaproteobacteria bacterium]|nr:MAG: hypothetical protein EPO31_09435 [Gammaproteobacteria bacterium]